jgi:hypothetical protein
MERAPQYRTRFDAVYEYSKVVFVNSRRYIGSVYRTISIVTLLVMFLVASHASAITDAEIFLTVINKPYTSTDVCATGNDCQFTVAVSNTPNMVANYFPTQEYSYAWGFPGAPLQLSTKDLQNIDYIWTSAGGKTFTYLQTSNFDDYNPLSNGAPTALYVTDTTGEAKRMRLQYAEQFVDGTLQADKSFRFNLTTLTPPQQSMPYQFTIHPYDDNNENRELAVWLSSTYAANSPTSVRSLYAGGARNHWIYGSDYIAYVGGLYDYAGSTNAINLVLDMDLDGTQMNLSTNYALFKVIKGTPATCVTQPGSCDVEFVSQYTTPVNGPITIAGSGRINGYNLLNTDYAGKWVDQDSIRQPLTPELIAKAEYRVQSGLIELSSNKVDTKGFAIDIAGITVGFSPRRNDSSVLLNNKYLPMIKLKDALINNAPNPNNDFPVKTFDFKMVGNWPGQADGLDVHGKDSSLQYTYLHIADDSMKVAAHNLAYEYTTVLQGNVGTGGLIHLGSYGTGRTMTKGHVTVTGVYVHRITHQRAGGQSGTGRFGAALVAALTCPSGIDVSGVTVMQLRVNDLGYGINSVNRPFNIGLGTSAGGPCSSSQATPTNVGPMTFTDFLIYLNPLSDSIIFNRIAAPSTVKDINFFDKTLNASPTGKVVIYPSNNSNFGYFICGTGSDTNTNYPSSKCWNTSGENGGTGTKNNVLYSGGGSISEIHYPYSP